MKLLRKKFILDKQLTKFYKGLGNWAIGLKILYNALMIWVNMIKGHEFVNVS